MQALYIPLYALKPNVISKTVMFEIHTNGKLLDNITMYKNSIYLIFLD